MGTPKSSGTGEAPSARHSITNAPNGSKNHNPNTGKAHNYAVPGCSLTKIEIKCSHAKEKKKPASIPQAHGSALHTQNASTHVQGPAPAAGAPASHTVSHNSHGSSGDWPAKYEGGNRILTIPEEGAAGKASPAHPASSHKNPGGESSSGYNTTEPALLKAEVSFNKAIMGVVPSEQKMTEKLNFAILEEAIKIDVEHSFGARTAGDKVKFTATVRGKCSRHPLWTITDGGKQVAAINRDIMEYIFLPPAPDKNTLDRVFHAWWLKDIKPRVYEVTCKTCAGADEIGSITIDVYPNMESKVSVSVGLAEKKKKGHSSKKHPLREAAGKFIKALEKIAKEFDIDLEKLVEWPRGKLMLSNKWEEDEKSPQAYWGGTVEMGLDPLIGFNTGHITIPVLKATKFIPKVVRKYVDVKVYWQLTGSVKLKGAVSWKLKPDQAVEVTGDVKETLGGELELEVGLGGLIGPRKKNVLDVFILGKTGIGVDGGLKVTDEGELELEGKASWKGLNVEGHVKLMNGMVDIDIEYEVIKGGESPSGHIVLIKKDVAASP